MIEEKKFKKAFNALHAMIICARKMAYDKDDYERIAALLDEAEYLVTMIAAPEDLTLKYRDQLELIAKRLNCLLPLQKFDE